MAPGRCDWTPGCNERHSIAMDRMKPKFSRAWTSQGRDRRFRYKLISNQFLVPYYWYDLNEFHSRLVRNAG